MLFNHFRYSKPKQSGFVLSYVLFSIAILAALATAYASMSRAKTQAEQISDGTDRIVNAFSVVRARINRCLAGDNLPTTDQYENVAPIQNGTYNNVPVGEVVNITCEDGGTLINQGPLIRPPVGFDQWLYFYNDNNTADDFTDDVGPGLFVVPAEQGGEPEIVNRVNDYFARNYTGLVETTRPDVDRGAYIYLNLQ